MNSQQYLVIRYNYPHSAVNFGLRSKKIRGTDYRNQGTKEPKGNTV